MTTVTDRKLTVPESEKLIGFVGDNKIEIRQFEISETALFGFNFKLDLQIGSHIGIVDLTKEIEDDKIILTWEVLQEHLPQSGLLYAQLRAFSDDDEIWHSKRDTYFIVEKSINAPDYFPSPLPSEFEQMEARVTAIQSDVTEKALEVEADRAEVEENTATVAENTQTAITKALEALNSAIAAKTSEDNAFESAENAGESETVASQALADLLAMLGSDVATLTNGKLTPSQIPNLSINDVFEVADTDAMLLLTAQRGDCALIIPDDIVTDSYILAADDPSILANWKKLGVSYVANAGYATTAGTAENADKINNHRLVTMMESQYAAAVLEDNTLYAVYPDEV